MARVVSVVFLNPMLRREGMLCIAKALRRISPLPSEGRRLALTFPSGH